jgi:hypothetical protein
MKKEASKVFTKYSDLQKKPWWQKVLILLSDPLHFIALTFTVIGMVIMTLNVIDFSATSVISTTAIVLLAADVCKVLFKVAQLLVQPPPNRSCTAVYAATDNTDDAIVESIKQVDESELNEGFDGSEDEQISAKPRQKPNRCGLTTKESMAWQIGLELVGVLLTLACTLLIIIDNTMMKIGKPGVRITVDACNKPHN